MTTQHPTGITGIDQVLCGGIPAGQLVVIETDSDSPGEALLRRLTLQQPTLFVSTMRVESEVEEFLAEHAPRCDLVFIGASTDRSTASRLVSAPLFQRIQHVDSDIAIVHRAQ